MDDFNILQNMSKCEISLGNYFRLEKPKIESHNYCYQSNTMTNEYLQMNKSRHSDAKIRLMQFVIRGNNLDCTRFSFRVQLIFFNV